MAREIKWNESWDYYAHERYWWTQRDSRGVCFEIRKRNDKFNLCSSAERIGVYGTIDDAMKAAADKWVFFDSKDRNAKQFIEMAHLITFLSSSDVGKMEKTKEIVACRDNGVISDDEAFELIIEFC